MRFLESYKYLDNLCKDIYGGISGYIQEIGKTPTGKIDVPGWENDDGKLKHYRHIRNQIVHETYANEENMCSPEDAV